MVSGRSQKSISSVRRAECEEARPADEQSRKFIETARQLGCDEDEAAFNEKLKRIARQKPRPPDAPAPKDDKEEAPE